jgi:hypothetical protein
MTMRRVVQKLKRDCFFCSVAMAAGLTYDKLGARVGWKIMSRVGDGGSQDDGSPNADWRMILKAGGFEIGTNMHRVWTAPGYVGTGIIRSLLWGRRAILDLYMGPNDGHAVYWDGENLHDPLPGRPYKTLDHVDHISNIFLIKDERDQVIVPVEPEVESNIISDSNFRRPRLLATPTRSVNGRKR